MTFEEFILEARDMGASDIYLTVGAPTVVRVNGELQNFKELSDVVVNRTILSILTAEQEQLLTTGNDIDFSFELESGVRQRVNVFRQSGKLACCIRLLNDKIPSLEDLKMPPILTELASKKRGLILVTGPTGSGKSTTLSSIVDYINKHRACHIITIEDPIEYRYTQAKATIHQREVGKDVATFSDALRSALREDPDVILVGEMRDYETISLAMTAAETGHLVLGTLHTSSAVQTIDRIIDACPPHAQEQARAQLANMFQGVVSQTLVPTADRKGRVAALEILIGTDAVKSQIRSNKIPQMESSMQSGARQGMCTLHDHLLRLYNRGVIASDVALEYAPNRTEMEKALANTVSGF
ncbi:MAG: type IV pilus twitching motility protein PilT [Oscillospiraceae bacterium]|nr:type IV pilus twitching motility protein PilT [Oscillospiraceae bacterium]MDD7429417.1 type IV pilus twitching motility protein PilT [Oscillospiraceae bacterium]MDY2847881.1 type IV pilus twitching motility protein PilT [Oscillospiraceae bacterium]